ncbi:MAG: sigma-70 family RNA polymerase sigma factor [Pirellulales bacterium]
MLQNPNELQDFRELMRCLCEGSEDAAWQLVDRYGGSVRRVVRRTLSEQLRTKFDSMDFMQAVWVSLFRERERFSEFESPEQFVGYLKAIAKNKLAMENRKRFQTQKRDVRREVGNTDDFPIEERLSAGSPRPSEVAQVRELWHVMLERESDQNRKIVELRLSGMTYDEIAASIGINERTARRVIDRLTDEYA